jgi:hypothetical protein
MRPVHIFKMRVGVISREILFDMGSSSRLCGMGGSSRSAMAAKQALHLTGTAMFVLGTLLVTPMIGK